ncbi:transposase [uncultured Desulfobacter sp.]|uniref:IS91 family transposase n=1 Tax=uncultured Desulfobacter sp. TaxID=240139 RepID=UPI002AAADED3|nr:transposase [uncultured Desulfobacter sp.]
MEKKSTPIKGFEQLYAAGDLKFPGNTATLGTTAGFTGLIKTIREKKWSGYAKAPCSGPENVLEYLGRYTHRVAISNHRIISFRDGKVVFTWKDRAHNDTTKEMIMDAVEFIRKFLLHVLPKGFKKIRHFGFLSPRHKTRNIELIRRLTGDDQKAPVRPADESVQEMMLRLTGVDIKACPKYGKGRLTSRYTNCCRYIPVISFQAQKKWSGIHHKRPVGLIQSVENNNGIKPYPWSAPLNPGY